jgi:hypothetical protein
MRAHRRRGQSLVETALVALVLYLLLAATIELGRATFGAQVLQDAARVAARETALLPFPPAETGVGALSSTTVLARVYDRRLLVVDLDEDADGDAVLNRDELDDLFAQMPAVNQQLRPLFIFEQAVVGGAPRNLLRYPGALLIDPVPTATITECGLAASGLTVAIPRVSYAGGETITDWLEVVEPVQPDAFPLAAGGLVALRLAYPFQAASLSGFEETTPADPFDPNLADPIVAAATEVGGVTDATGGPPAALAGVEQGVGTYSGPYGLGRQLALGREVRPFRRVQVVQAVFRREVLQ